MIKLNEKQRNHNSNRKLPLHINTRPKTCKSVKFILKSNLSSKRIVFKTDNEKKIGNEFVRLSKINFAEEFKKSNFFNYNKSNLRDNIKNFNKKIVRSKKMIDLIQYRRSSTKTKEFINKLENKNPTIKDNNIFEVINKDIDNIENQIKKKNMDKKIHKSKIRNGNDDFGKVLKIFKNMNKKKKHHKSSIMKDRDCMARHRNDINRLKNSIFGIKGILRCSSTINYKRN